MNSIPLNHLLKIGADALQTTAQTLSGAVNELLTSVMGKANKVSDATNGNFAGLDVNGNLTDSGKKESDFMSSDGVEANPTGTATGTLTSLGINGDKYEIPGGGSSTLADLTDVNISSPSDGQILQYDAASRKWVNHINVPEYISISVDIYSAASDTVTFTDQTGQKTVTTDTNGHGRVTIVCINGDSITFTSSVAKNPDNLSQAYSKTFTITYATASIYVMPVDDALYWYGYKSSNCDELSTANGWTTGSETYVFVPPTYNTNYIAINANGSSQSGIATKTTTTKTTAKCIAQGVTISGTLYGELAARASKNYNDFSVNSREFINTTSVALYSNSTSISGNYAICGAPSPRAFNLFAFWLE